GPLLPEDEVALGAAWLLVPRSVYEVVAARPGQGLALRDLRTGDTLDVSDEVLPAGPAPMARSLVCARAVPDGERQRLVGGAFPVAPGEVDDVLGVCDEGDPRKLCAWVAAMPSRRGAGVSELQERLERRWLDESVPALGGLTPRQAAADPERA